MDEETKRILDDHERRIRLLEGNTSKQKKQESNKDYKGLAGGIRFLIDNKFLNEPKTTKDIMSELKREGYHYTQSGIASTLSETFTKSQKILNRIKEKDGWKYVLRK